MLKGFVSYSHRDTEFLEELKIILKVFERERRAKFWTDQAIDAGTQWHPEIMAQLEKADIAIILLSRHLYASDFVHDVELPRLKARRDANEITVVPIRISPAREPRVERYQWLREEQQIPRDDRFIEIASNRNEIWTEVEIELSRTLDNIIERREAGITNSAEVEDRRASARAALRHAQDVVRQVPDDIGGIARADIERALNTVDSVLTADPLSQQDALSSADLMLENLRFARDEHFGMYSALGTLRIELTDMFKSGRSAGYPSSTDIGIPGPQMVPQQQVADAARGVEERFDELERRLEELEAERGNTPNNAWVNAAAKEVTEEVREQHKIAHTLLSENLVDWVGVKTAVDRSVRAVRRFVRRIPVYGIAALNGIAQNLSQASDLLKRSGEAFEKTARNKPENDLSSDKDGVPASPKPGGDVFTDIPGVTPEMVVVPAGEFLMGSPNNEAGRFDDEGPQHTVTISRPFAVGCFPVIFDEWDKARELGFDGRRLEDRFGRGRQPVINVSWEEAKSYADWLAKYSGKPYRLLTEAEWEYACRAGSTTRFSFGNGKALFGDGGLGQYAWYFGNAGGKTHPVGEKKPNAFGLYDMHGNVWEWVSDLYGAYESGSQTDPQGPSTGQSRVIRGGSWSYFARNLRSANRHNYWPDYRYTNLGFRLARTYD